MRPDNYIFQYFYTKALVVDGKVLAVEVENAVYTPETRDQLYAGHIEDFAAKQGFPNLPTFLKGADSEIFLPTIRTYKLFEPEIKEREQQRADSQRASLVTKSGQNTPAQPRPEPELLQVIVKGLNLDDYRRIRHNGDRAITFDVSTKSGICPIRVTFASDGSLGEISSLNRVASIKNNAMSRFAINLVNGIIHEWHTNNKIIEHPNTGDTDTKEDTDLL